MWDSFINIESMKYIAKQVIPEIDIVEERGTANGTHCSIDENGNQILHWDSLMYEYYEQELLILDSFPYIEEKDEKIVVEMRYNCLGILLNHLSDKYGRYLYVSSALKKKANEFNYPYFNFIKEKLPNVAEWRVPYFIQTGVVKLLIMYHEIGHCLFATNSDEKEKWESIVIDNLKLMYEQDKDLFLPKGKKEKKESSTIIEDIIGKTGRNLEILSELAADTYALSKAYATTHLNITAIDKETISEGIMLAYLRYIDISSQYGYIVDFWKELPTMCLINKKKIEDGDDNSLWQKSVENTIRCNLWAVISLMNILMSDNKTWGYNPPEGYSLKDPRIKKVLSFLNINSHIYSEMEQVALSKELFNSIVEESNDMEKKSETFDYPAIPDNAVIITWMSIQYNNCKGLDKLGKRDYDGAIKDFEMAGAITERYLGHYHRLTAREYNNLCSCYLSKYKEAFLDNNNHNNTNMEEWLEKAGQYSSIAIDILGKLKEEKELQAGAIYQNAAECMTFIGNDKGAIDYYLISKKIKEKNTIGYEVTNAITDYSLAIAYYRIKHYRDARKCCLKALNYYRRYGNSDDETLQNLEEMYINIKNKMNPSNDSMIEIIQMLMNGETVILDQYLDYDDSDTKQ